MGSPVYLDFNASVPPAPEVVEAMLPWLSEFHANPHSDHFHGARAAVALEKAKESIAGLIGADGDDIVLTSSATESNNLALLGYLRHRGGAGALIHSAVEHKCVLGVASSLRESGCEVIALGVDRRGNICPKAVAEAKSQLKQQDVLVSVMHANNELGTIAPLEEIARELDGSGAILHTDAAQSVGRIPFDVTDLRTDVVTLSSHKLGGPAGIAGLYIAPDLRSEFHPMFHGGGQQRGLRPGTIPVFLAIGFASACEVAKKRLMEHAEYVEKLANVFTEVLIQRGIAFERLGNPDKCLPGLRSLRLIGVDARDALDRSRRVLSASTGSACAAGEIRASHVMRAIGLSEQEATGVFRVGFGSSTSLDEVSAAAIGLADAIVTVTN